jgi:hypothetical protein
MYACVCVVGGSTNGSGESEWRRLKWGYMIDGYHLPIWNRTKQPLAVVFSGTEKRVEGQMLGAMKLMYNINPNGNCHFESPPYNDYIVIKKDVCATGAFSFRGYLVILLTVYSKKQFLLMQLPSLLPSANHFPSIILLFETFSFVFHTCKNVCIYKNTSLFLLKSQ